MKDDATPQPVKDAPMESGIRLNNILTALGLMVMSWVGWNIEQIKTTQSSHSTDIVLNAVEIGHLDDHFNGHIVDHTKLDTDVSEIQKIINKLNQL